MMDERRIESMKEAAIVGDWDAVAGIIRFAEEQFRKGLYTWTEYTAFIKALAGIQ